VLPYWYSHTHSAPRVHICSIHILLIALQKSAILCPLFSKRLGPPPTVLLAGLELKTVSILQVPVGPSRRRIPRIPVGDGVWVYWESPPYRDVSRILDLSAAGMFLETRARKREGELVQLHFLVQEGPIRAEAVVRHVSSGRGLGVKINSVLSQDTPQLKRLLSRLRENQTQIPDSLRRP